MAQVWKQGRKLGEWSRSFDEGGRTWRHKLTLHADSYANGDLKLTLLQQGSHRRGSEPWSYGSWSVKQRVRVKRHSDGFGELRLSESEFVDQTLQGADDTLREDGWS